LVIIPRMIYHTRSWQDRQADWRLEDLRGTLGERTGTGLADAMQGQEAVDQGQCQSRGGCMDDTIILRVLLRNPRYPRCQIKWFYQRDHANIDRMHTYVESESTVKSHRRATVKCTTPARTTTVLFHACRIDVQHHQHDQSRHPLGAS